MSAHDTHPEIPSCTQRWRHIPGRWPKCRNSSIYFNRAVTLIRAGRAREAQGEIEMLRKLDILGSNRSYLAAIDQLLPSAAVGRSSEDVPDSP